MFITICNLPLSAKTKEIKKLITEKCQLEDVIFGELTREKFTPTKKITIGLADECDAAIVFRKLNGLLFNGQPMVLEDSRQKKGPVPGEIPQMMNPMNYQATAMHLQSQQMMMPGYNAMGMMSTGYYNPMQGMLQPAVMDPQGYGCMQQPMIMSNEETMLDQHQIMHPQPVPSYQRNQPRNQMNQPHSQMNQPVPSYQRNQPRNQMNQPHSQMKQPQQQINKPKPLLANRSQHQPQKIPRNRQEHPQLNQRMHQQASIPPSNYEAYEEPRNDCEEPYREQPVVHKTRLDWDIPTREVVFQEADPVWGVRTQKPSEITPNDFELDNPSNRTGSDPRRTRWDKSHSHAMDKTSYDYHEPESHNEAYQPNIDGRYDNYDNPHPSYVETGYNPERQPHQDYDNFELHNRKRSYNETRDEYQYNDGNPGHEGQDNMRKRPRIDYYENTYDSNEMAVGHDESADDYIDYDVDLSELAKGSQLSFKKFKFSHKMPIGGFKAFEEYMFRNLLSKRFAIDVESYNTMYSVCRNIMKRLTRFLGINLRKYSYFLLNYIQVTIEMVLGESMSDKRVWKHKILFDAFDKNYTYPQFFQMFQNWFEQYDKLEFKASPKFVAIMSQPIVYRHISSQPIIPNIKQHKPFVKVKAKEGKPVNQGKPGSKLARAMAAHNKAFPLVKPEIKTPNQDKSNVKAVAQAKLNVKPTAQAKPNVNATAQAKPNVKPAAQAKPNVKPTAHAKPNVKATAQAKPNAKTIAKAKPTVKASANAKPWVKPNAPETWKTQKENFVKQEKTDPETEAADQIVKKKIQTLLELPLDATSRMFDEIRAQFSPDLARAVDLEIAGLDAAITANMTDDEMRTVGQLYRPFRGAFKRSMHYRLSSTHIALTAKVTFASKEKQPTLAACNEFFNARQGRVLHIEKNVALVLFSTNDTFKKMCDEKDVEIDGCKIQEIIPLDLDTKQMVYLGAIEDSIKADKTEKILDLVFNKAYFEVNLLKDTKFSDDNEEQQTPVQSETNINSNAKKSNVIADKAKDIAIDKCDSKIVNKAESEEKASQNSNTRPPCQLITKTQKDSNTVIDATTNNQSEIKTEATLNTETKQIERTEVNENSNNEVETLIQQPADEGDRNEKIKEFLDDFERVINENEEVFMSEDDLEDFEL